MSGKRRRAAHVGDLLGQGRLSDLEPTHTLLHPPLHTRRSCQLLLRRAEPRLRSCEAAASCSGGGGGGTHSGERQRIGRPVGVVAGGGPEMGQPALRRD